MDDGRHPPPGARTRGLIESVGSGSEWEHRDLHSGSSTLDVIRVKVPDAGRQSINPIEASSVISINVTHYIYW
jgi:hypothetical protein